jgi:hypothetical protein
MNQILQWITEVTPTPTPLPVIDEDMVTPGVVGFLVTFLIAVATVLLIIDMTRRIRRVRYRAEVQEQLKAERGESSENDQTASS